MAVHYEWDVELQTSADVDGYDEGEVIDHNFVKSYAEAKALTENQTPEEGYALVIVLVRDDDEERTWAYMEDGELPECFADAGGADAAKVPQRFIKEVAAA